MEDPTRRLAFLMAMIKLRDVAGLLSLGRHYESQGDSDGVGGVFAALAKILAPFDVDVVGHPCTGYNEYHLDTNLQPTRKGRVITKAPQEVLDGAVAAINEGRALHLGHDGRNDYVIVDGYIFGLHRQVFNEKRQLFPVGPISSLPSGLQLP